MTDKKPTKEKKDIVEFRNFDQVTQRVFEMFDAFKAQMDSAFEQFTGHRISALEPLRDFEQPHLHPLWTIKEDPNILTISVDLPYVKKENVKLQAEENSLTVIAELDRSITFDAGFTHHQKTEFQRFEQTFRLPCKIDVDEVKATFEQGILTITAPRSRWSSAPPHGAG